MCVGGDAGQIFDVNLVDFDVFLSVTGAVSHRRGQSSRSINRDAIVDLVGGVVIAPVSHLPSHVGREIGYHLIEGARSRERGNKGRKIVSLHNQSPGPGCLSV